MVKQSKFYDKKIRQNSRIGVFTFSTFKCVGLKQYDYHPHVFSIQEEFRISVMEMFSWSADKMYDVYFVVRTWVVLV